MVGGSTRVSKSYATGAVSGTVPVGGFLLIGGLLGSGGGGSTLSNSYWDTATTMQAMSDGSGATGLTTDQMKATSGTYPSELGDGFQLSAGSYPKVKKCTVCTGTLEFSDDLVPGQ